MSMNIKISKKTHLDEAMSVYRETNSSDKASEILSKKYGVKFSGRKIRMWASSIGATEKNPKNVSASKQVEDGEIFKEATKRKHKESKYYLISSAQNATPINSQLWENMLAYCDYLNGFIEVIPIRYKNPTSNFKDLPSDWWDNRLEPYLIANRHNIHPSVSVIADLKTQPTAVTPLSGIEGLTSNGSCIIGHPRQHFATMPTLENEESKFLLSTGSITESNYTDSKSGKKGEFHHTYGFVIVEIESDSVFHVRQVSAKTDGSFYDLDYFVKEGKVTKSDSNVECLVMGDLHIGHTCDVSLNSTYDMLKRFNPSNVIIHDIMEGSSISHHEKRDPFIALGREQDGSWCVEKEISDVLSFLDTVIDYNPVIVKSNHDDFVDRWLLDNDWKKEKNKYAYLKYAKLKADGELPNGILPYNIEQKYGGKVICLSDNSSFKVRNIELGVHGHIGNGGSRGSAVQFKRLNTKLITGHTHSPLKMDNLTTVGTLTKLRLNYNKGLSAWYNSNVIIHKNGKTQQILINKGQWTTI